MKASNNHFLNKYSGLKPTLVFRSNTYFLVNSTQPYTGLQKGYHSNKQLKYSFCYEDGKLCGTEKYDRNGQLREKANYKANCIDGRLHGEYEQYDRNGQLMEKANFIDGKKYVVFLDEIKTYYLVAIWKIVTIFFIYLFLNQLEY